MSETSRPMFLYGVGLTKDETAIAERAIEGGALDVAILNFYDAEQHTPEEDAAGVLFDEMLSALLGRTVEAWQPHRCNILDRAITNRYRDLRGY